MSKENFFSRKCPRCKEEQLKSEFLGSSGWCRSCMAAYHLENKERRLLSMRVATAKREAKKYGVENTLTVDELRRYADLVGTQCESCSNPWNELHHVRPLSMNGSNSAQNIALLCGDCHKASHKLLRPWTANWSKMFSGTANPWWRFVPNEFFRQVQKCS